MLKFFGLSLFLVFAAQAQASTEATAIFCKKYPSAVGCDTPTGSCNTCHASPPGLNPYGEDLRNNLGGPISTALEGALTKTEGNDSDGDGSTNLEEVSGNGAPGNKNVRPAEAVALVYDTTLALKRLKANYCGESVSYEDMQKLKASADGKAFLHAELSKCLSSDYWKKEALHRLADKKIQPLAATGYGGNVVIADYRYDYWMFSYIMSDDRDARELLSAQYHVNEKGEKVEGRVHREEIPTIIGQRLVIAGGQPLDSKRRAGMMTTQWFLAFYTMFSPLPRNTASQVYREYLGMDIAKGEGLMPVANEPRDVDNKNVKQEACAVCHSTLDPLSYAFSTYTGIETSVVEILTNKSGTYDSDRQPWESEGVLMGQPVKDLLDWADKARNSDPFKQNLARMMWRQALNREPMPHEKKEFDDLWKGLPAENYSINKMLHRLIETNAFGGRRS